MPNDLAKEAARDGLDSLNLQGTLGKIAGEYIREVDEIIDEVSE